MVAENLENDDPATQRVYGLSGNGPLPSRSRTSVIEDMLRAVGLRPTRQRVALGQLLFGQGDRHLVAEVLYKEALLAKVSVTRATVYNTLHEFTKWGLLRQVWVQGGTMHFDTNVNRHHHFYLEDSHELVDFPISDVVVTDIPQPLSGYEFAGVSIVVRVRRRADSMGQPVHKPSWKKIGGALRTKGKIPARPKR